MSDIKQQASARERLAEKIAKHAALVGRVEAIKRAQTELGKTIREARKAVEAAAATVDGAKEDVAQHLADEAMGRAGEPPLSQKDARAALAEAEDRRDDLLAASTALASELDATLNRATLSKLGLDTAKAAAVAESPEVARLIETYMAKWAEVIGMRRALEWLELRALGGQLGGRCEPELEDTPLVSSWQRAWSALEADAEAVLPG